MAWSLNSCAAGVMLLQRWEATKLRYKGHNGSDSRCSWQLHRHTCWNLTDSHDSGWTVCVMVYWIGPMPHPSRDHWLDSVFFSNLKSWLVGWQEGLLVLLSPYRLWVCIAHWYICWLWHYINRLFPYLASLLTFCLTFLFSYLSNSSLTIGLFRFHAGGRKRQPNLALVFLFILCCCIFC